MLKNSRKLSILNKIVKQQRSESIVDIILFGSTVRGKEEPGDIDVCIIFRDKIDLNRVNIIENEFEKKMIKAHMSFLTVDNFFTKPHSLIKTLLLEGKSLFTNKMFSENYSFSGKTIFLYELKNMKPSNKVRFIYALKGRGKNRGILSSIKDKISAPGFMMVPTMEEHKIVSVLEHWHVSYKRMKILL